MLEQTDLDAIEALISRHETKARRIVVSDTKTCARIARKHWKRRIIGVTVLAFIEWGFSRAKEL